MIREQRRSASFITLTGTWAIVIIFAFSRWGTYLGVPPIFITEVLLAIAIFQHVARSSFRIGAPPSGIAGTLLPMAFTWAALRLALSTSWDLIALRDAVPYLYAIVGMFAAWSYSVASNDVRQRTARFLRAALFVHLGWVLGALIAGIQGQTLSSNTYVFQIRADIDSALVSILAGLCLHTMLGGRRMLWNLTASAACVWVIFELPNRSGILSLASVVALVVLVHLAARGRSSHSKAFVVILLPLLLVAAYVALPYTASGARLMHGMGFDVTNAAITSARGTTEARLDAWQILYDYWLADTARFLFGVGFGPDFLYDSHTNELLGSETFEGVRSPHNYLIGTALRTGLVGLLITTALLGAVVRAVIRLRAFLSQGPLLLTSSVTVAALMPPAMVGVVFEAPFGAVPMFWAAGVLIAASRQRPDLDREGEVVRDRNDTLEKHRVYAIRP